MNTAPANRLGILLVLTGIATAPTTLLGQAVRGQLIDSNQGAPVAHAFVIMRDSTDREVARVLTDVNGSFLIEAPASGVYVLQTAIIGWNSWSSPELTLVQGQVFAYRMEVPLEAIRLDALVVEGERECELSPDVGEAVSLVWEEARKALEAVSWTSDSGRLRYQAIEFNRDLHPETLRSFGGQATRQSGMSTGSPFTSAPAAELSAKGYIQSTDGGWKPYGPDAAVLLSETFANDHCFIVQPHPDEPASIGLGFEPVRGREIPDIRGVMWLDRETARLRSLEFQYDRLPWPVSLRHAGGQINFEQLPNGLWFVSEWRLRLPRLSRATRGTALGQYTVTSYSETGGYVVQLRREDGTPVARARAFASTPVSVQVDSALPMADPEAANPSGIGGAITDVLSGSTIAGAVVLLLDPTETIRAITISDSSGTFAVSPPRAGSYSLSIHRAGYRPTTSSLIDLPSGMVIRTRVNLRPSEANDPERHPESFRSFGDVVPAFRFGRAEIERSGATNVFDLALTIGGVRAVGALDRPALLLNEESCTPTAYVDGNPSATSQVLHTPFGSWVALVEFSLGPRDTPPDNLASDPEVAKCGTILIWSAAS